MPFRGGRGLFVIIRAIIRVLVYRCFLLGVWIVGEKDTGPKVKKRMTVFIWCNTVWSRNRDFPVLIGPIVERGQWLGL